jgi:hypothetical protein
MACIVYVRSCGNVSNCGRGFSPDSFSPTASGLKPLPQNLALVAQDSRKTCP